MDGCIEPRAVMVTKNVLPTPSSDSTHILPPMRSARSLLMARPKPVPGRASNFPFGSKKENSFLKGDGMLVRKRNLEELYYQTKQEELYYQTKAIYSCCEMVMSR